jgi:hypothetical protein
MALPGPSFALAGPLAAKIAERRLVARFRTAHATVAARAIALDDLRWIQKRRLERLARAGAVHEAGEGRWYLDEPVYAELVAWRRRMVAVTIVAAILAALAAYFLP